MREGEGLRGKRRRAPSRLAFEITAIYSVSGIAWICAPRDVVSPLVHALTFAVPSVLLVFLLVRRLLQHLEAAETAAERAEVEVIVRLARVAEWKDDTLGGHNHRIAHYCLLVARQMGLSPERQRHLYHGALLHDIGKVGIPDEILSKRTALTEDELNLMRGHVRLGAQLLEGSDDPLLRAAHRIALTHHERWDGTGYPTGLQGKKIPLEGRIAAVCDVFDALLSERHYKAAWTLEAALEYLRARRGRDFDPEVVDALLACVGSGLISPPRDGERGPMRPTATAGGYALASSLCSSPYSSPSSPRFPSTPSSGNR